MKNKKLSLRRTLGLGLASLVLAIFSSNLTAPQLTDPAIRLMHLVRHRSLNDHVLDSAGIPQIRYNRLDNRPYSNPVYVAVYGLYYYDQWQANGENAYFLNYYRVYPPAVKSRAEYRQLFFNTAHWLEKNLSRRRYKDVEYGIFEYHFPWGVYQLRPPWRSAMAQSLAIQVFLRAWLATDDARYLELARLARNALYVPVAEGGVTYFEAPDRWWYEEYAAPDATPSYVLNGMLHVLIGLREHALLTDDNESENLLRYGVNALIQKLPKFENRRLNWTNYDAIGGVANYKYHHININLLCRLHALLRDPRLAVWERWTEMQTPFFQREFLLQRPDPLDWMILLINYAGSTTLLLAASIILRRWYRTREVRNGSG